MSALSELLLDDREEEQGAACDLSASADTQAPEAEQAAKGASPSPQVSKEEQEKQRRAEHEAKEAARKAEFEEKQRRKKEKKERARQAVRAMSDADVMAAAIKMIEAREDEIRKDFDDDTNGVIEMIILQALKAGCQCDTDFARSIMNPDKCFANCIRYVGKQAYEKKKDDIQKQIRGGAQYAAFSFPTKLYFQWATDYFNDLNAPEDKEPEEKFKPQPYRPAMKSPAKPMQPIQAKPKEENTQLSLF